MTYSMIIGKYNLIFSDTHFKDFRKKPTISVYDADTNIERKIASFNSQETFEWFIEAVVKADRKTEPQTDCYKLINAVVKLDMSREDKFKVIELLEQHCEKCKHYLFTDVDGYYCEHETYSQPCHYEPKTEPQAERSSE